MSHRVRRRSATRFPSRRKGGKASHRSLQHETLEQRSLLAGIPELISDFAPGLDSSFPSGFVGFKGSTYFASYLASSQSVALARTDGSSIGTFVVRDFGSEADYLDRRFEVADGVLIFTLQDNGSFPGPSDDTTQFWKSDGTESGTVALTEPLQMGGVSDGVFFETLNGKILTSVYSDDAGQELRSIDIATGSMTLVKDIRPGSDGSYPYALFKHNGVVYFSADDGIHGDELWRSDGTAAGTYLVKDLNTNNDPVHGRGSAFPRGFVAGGTGFFFGARSDGADTEPWTDDDTGQLWESDGTGSGTRLVKDFGPGSAFFSYNASLVNLNGTIFGVVSTPETGGELWKSDGTSNGTVLVKDINTTPDPDGGTFDANISGLTGGKNFVFFAADDGVHGTELWRSDGTAAGTVLVRDIDPNGSGVDYLFFRETDLNGNFYFAASEEAHGRELWKSDGTSAGTVLLRDINQQTNYNPNGTDSSSPFYMTMLRGQLYFAADNGIVGSEPWSMTLDSNSSPPTLDPLADRTIDENAPQQSVALAGITAGTGESQSLRVTAWSSNASLINSVTVVYTSPDTTGTVKFTPIPDRYGTSTIVVTVEDPGKDKDFDTIEDNQATSQSFTVVVNSTGCAPGGVGALPVLLANLAAGDESSFPSNFTSFQGETYFSANNTQLWKTDGTTAGTVMVFELPAGNTYIGYPFAVAQGKLIFPVIDPNDTNNPFDSTTQLWKTDGTGLGTAMLLDSFLTTSSSGGVYYEAINGKLVIALKDDEHGEELWGVDVSTGAAGMLNDINPGPDGSRLYEFFPHNGFIYFPAYSSVVGKELWRTDGTTAGTVLVKDLLPGFDGTYPNSSYPNGFVSRGNDFFFAARSNGPDGINYTADDSVQLWKSDGTEAGTALVKDFGPGSRGSNPYLSNANGTIFGAVTTPEIGNELWKSDGTEAGTVLVKDIRPDGTSAFENSSYPRELIAVNGLVYFTADDGTHGRELWVSDGTSLGTKLVRDIVEGGESGVFSLYYRAATPTNLLYFPAGYYGECGQELWVATSSSAGAVLSLDINTTPTTSGGTDSSNPLYLTTSQGFVFFTANDGEHGWELWAVSATNLPPEPVGSIPDLEFEANHTVEIVVSPDLFVDPDGDAITYSSDLADGDSLPSWIDFDPDTVTYTVKAPDSALGDWTIRLTATDDGVPPLSGSTTFVITIIPDEEPWQNHDDPFDVDDDDVIAPADAIQVINYLNSPYRGPLTGKPNPNAPMYIDVDGDNNLTPSDAIIVINVINGRKKNPEGEPIAPGEFAASTPPAVASQRSPNVTLPSLAPKPSLAVVSRAAGSMPALPSSTKQSDWAAVVDEVFREENLLNALTGMRPRSSSNRSGNR